MTATPLGRPWSESSTRRLLVPATTAAQRMLADRGSLLIGVFFYLIVSVVLSALWRAAAEHGPVAGYSARALTWYAFTAEAAVCAIEIRLIERVGDDIGSGAVTIEMLRPAPVAAVRFAFEFGRALVNLAVLVAFGMPVAWLIAGPAPSAPALLLAVPALVMAVAVNLVMQHVVAAAAFWTRDGRASWFLYQKAVFILGGMLLPIQVLPSVLQPIAAWLPFTAMAYAPARLASGHVSLVLLAGQASWFLVLAALAGLIFAAGQRHLEVVGG